MMSTIFEKSKDLHPIFVENRWCVHSYYTLCPYAPDGSGRLLLSGADLDNNFGEVMVLSPEGTILNRFEKNKLHTGFYHTGFWQTWSPDCRFIYYQGGSLEKPKIVKHELATGIDTVMNGDMEGAPPFGEPIVSGLLGMLYSAGYGNGKFFSDQAPVPFQKRQDHGLFEYRFDPMSTKLIYSVGDILENHPFRDELLNSDKEIKSIHGSDDGLTLMSYCVRWNHDGSRALFYFGNHCVDKSRGEPKITYVFTTDRHFKELHLALDFSFGKRNGVHWSWHPDGEHLIGYGSDPEDPKKLCLAQVNYDGTDYKKISKHASGGHPSISPVDFDLLVTDDSTNPGEVLFIDIKTDKVIKNYYFSRVFGESEPKGRNPLRVCHHPVFSRDGKKVLINTLPGKNATLFEITI